MNSKDDIPLAKRINYPKTISRNSFFALILLILGLGVSFIIFSANRISNEDVFSNNSTSFSESIEKDSLLGHFPYPEASREDLVLFSPGIFVHKDIFDKFTEMKSKASKSGISLQLLSGFRSINLQRDIFYENKSIRKQTAIERSRVSAPPGYSEHSTGYAIDVGDGTYPNTHFEVEFEQTPAFKWMKKYAPKYHFVLSFPKNNKQGISYEPWHWRFEGTVEALRKFEPANKTLGLK